MPAATAALHSSSAPLVQSALLGGAADVDALALGTLWGPSRAVRNAPGVLAVVTTKQSLSEHFDFTSFNLQGLAVHQGVGHFPVG